MNRPLQNSMKASAQFLDRDFQPNYTKNNRLSIQLRLDGFSFAQIDSISKKVLLIEDYTIPVMLGDEAVYQNEKVNLRLEALFAETQMQSQKYKSVHLVIDNPFFTLIPSVLFEEKYAPDYLRQVHQPPENSMIKTDLLSSFDSRNVYAVYAPLFFNFSDHFVNFEIRHASTVYIQQMMVFQKTLKGSSVFIDVASSSMLVIAFDGDRLLFSNSFAFKEKEDFIYFILLVYNQLNFKTETVPLFFSGNIDRTSPLYAIAYQYIRFLDFPLAKKSGLVYGNDIPESVGSKYCVLTQAVLCE